MSTATPPFTLRLSKGLVDLRRVFDKLSPNGAHPC
jgi:hypothetical protein